MPEQPELSADVKQVLSLLEVRLRQRYRLVGEFYIALDGNDLATIEGLMATQREADVPEEIALDATIAVMQARWAKNPKTDF
ncbi:Hypothetical protein PBC10988_23300 [Planctomycetales bacterium 10988]|nr:Hypothetical protein PBC10988_23300 [Planctomycetales bacterium 10988]